MVTRQALKLTKQRQIILEELQKVRSHPSANEVYALVRRRLPRISLATVYRNLELLAATGLIRKLALAGSQNRFDGTIDNHYHIRCLRCDRVDDVLCSPLPLVEEASITLNGYQLVGHRLEFFGVCPRCQGKKPDTPQPQQPEQA